MKKEEGETEMNNGLTQATNNKLWIGLGIGAAIGVVLALTQRKNDKWHSARRISQRVADRTGEFADAGKDIAEHIRVIYNESRKLANDAADLWSQGRKLVRA